MARQVEFDLNFLIAFCKTDRSNRKGAIQSLKLSKTTEKRIFIS